MSRPDLEALLQSPLDDDREPSGWGSAALGLVAAVVAVVGLSLALGLWTTAEEAPPGAASGPEPPASGSVVEPASPFPDGFSAISASVGMKAVAMVVEEAGVVVSFAAATERGSDPLTTPAPLGGRWQIEGTDGSVVGASRLIYDRAHSGVVGAAFPELPNEGDVVRMTERWDPDERSGSSEIPFTGTPFTTTDAVDIDVGDGVRLGLSQVDLGRHLGRIVWTLSGPGEPTGITSFDVLMIDQEGVVVGNYVSMPGPRDPTQSAGVVDLFWDQGFNVHPDEGSTVRVTATLQLVSPEAVDVVFDLTLVPSE